MKMIRPSGSLSPIWIAGTMKDKLSKNVVNTTDIKAIVDQLMQEQQVNFAPRLSGMLIKGLVVVYSKKTQYMLIDCEEIINKIMQSFKPGEVNLPEGLQKKANPNAVTLVFQDEDDNPITIPIEDWLQAANPEKEYEEPRPPIDFTISEASQQVPQFSDYSSSQTATQNLPEDYEEPIHPPPERDNYQPEPAIPEWDNLPDNDDYDAMPAPDYEEPEDEEPKAAKQKVLVIDNKIELPDKNDGGRRRARPTAVRKPIIAPQNDELEGLFELARKEFAKPPVADTVNDVDDDYGGFGYDEVELQRDEMPGNISTTTDDEGGAIPNRRGSLTNDDVVMSSLKRASLSGSTTPHLFGDNFNSLESPYPNLKLAIEQTPRRTAQDSITAETFKIRNKIRDAIEGKEEVTFDHVFAGSSRHGAAIGFYQLLVLKSLDYINFVQTEPFGEIVISQGPNFNK